MQLEVDLGERVSVPGRIAKGDPLEGDRRRGGVREEGTAGRERRTFREVEHPRRDRSSVRARVELRREVAKREVELGREHQHRQRGLEPDIAFREADADDDGDERDPQGGSELEHRAGEKRGA